MFMAWYKLVSSKSRERNVYFSSPVLPLLSIVLDRIWKEENCGKLGSCCIRIFDFHDFCETIVKHFSPMHMHK